MKCEQFENKVILSEYSCFDIEETLECGQCFRFSKLGEKEYVLIAQDKVLYIQQMQDLLVFSPCTLEEFDTIWRPYFDLDRDYEGIKRELVKIDSVMAAAIQYAGGLRIVKQDVWECLLSFIISQNNNIPNIKQIIKKIAAQYGNPLGEYYSFPTPQQLSNATVDELRGCNAGFRAKYIVDAVRKVLDHDVELEKVTEMKPEEAQEYLMQIKGVGPKVADCVLLYGYGKHEVFPKDVWVKRAMQFFYFANQEVSMKSIQQFAQERYGDKAAFAQQYLFHYSRTNSEVKFT